jgi:hypothetical protein
MNTLISLFIDNELDLDEKIDFVERIHEDRDFKNESVELLNMEKIIRADVVDRIPALKMKMKKKRIPSVFRWMGLWVPAAAAAILIAFVVFYHPGQVRTASHRFVIYRPDVTQAEIAGTFTGWRRIPLNQIGTSGYWDITLSLPGGEHRFTYILDGEKKFADPTVATRELDDFGGQNSIISVESKT